MVVIGLTGGVASGKSTVSALLATLGAEVIDADSVSAEVLATETIALKTLFGAKVLDKTGAPNKTYLKQQVFADAKKRAQLEALLHPKIQARIQAQLAASRAAVVVVEVPLLIEAGWQAMFDQVWVVEADPETQRQRLMTRDGMDAALAEQIIASQTDNATRRRYADVVLENTRDIASLQAELKTRYAALVT